MINFNEEKLEKAIIKLFKQQNISHLAGDKINRDTNDVVLVNDFEEYLKKRYAKDNISDNEIKSIIRDILDNSTSSLYESNKRFIKKLSDGIVLKRSNKKKIY